jgi:uncharacterized phage protein gp47/JayE
MPLNIPARRDVVGATQAYVRSNLPELDPSTERRSFIGGLVKSLSSALHDWYVALKRYADNEPFPQTASKDFLYAGWWRDITGLSPNPAAASSGTILIEGTHGTIVPPGSALASGNNTYVTVSGATIVTQSLAISSLTRSGSTAVVETTAADHNLATGMSVTISGASQSGYNVTALITVTADNEFTYDLGATTPTSPATGSPILTATWGNAEITCDVTGEQGNLGAGATVTFANTISGVVGTARVTFGTIGGGAAAESVESYRARILEALGTDFGMFSAAEIKIVAKTVPGVTRVWVREASLFGTNGVNEGQVVIAFMRDNDANPFPSSSETAAVKRVIVENLMPAHTAEEDVSVLSPTPLAVDIEVQIVPDTPSMRRAVRASLAAFFAEGVDFGTDVPHNSIICAINDTYDRESRRKLASFTLNTPSVDVTVSGTELPVLGDVEFV